ncbi:hypothetical protein CIB84_007901, partial [Bambusicola thoracicus]
DAVCATTDEERLLRMLEVIQQLPMPQYRSENCCPQSGELSPAAFQRTMMRLQALSHTRSMMPVCVEVVDGSEGLMNSAFSRIAEIRFDYGGASRLVGIDENMAPCGWMLRVSKPKLDKETIVPVMMMFRMQLWSSLPGHSSPSGPKSVRVSSPATKLFTVEEAQTQRRGPSSSPALTHSRDIEVEEDPAAAGGKFHTVIDFPSDRPSPRSKLKESPAGSWCSCFRPRRPFSVAKHQLQRNAKEPSETEVVVLAGSTNCCSSDDSLPQDNSDGEKELIHIRAFISPGCAEDADMSLPDTAVTSLDYDPASLQCSPAQAQPKCPDSSTSVQEQVSIAKEELSLVEGY